MTAPLLDAATLYAVLSHAPGFFYLMDLNFHVLYMNRFQPPYTAETTIGTHIDKFFTPDIAEHAHRYYKKVIETGEEQGLEYFVDYPDGVRRWYFTHVSALRDDAGKISGVICVTNETTAQKTAELELKKTQIELIEASRRAGMAEVVTGVLHNVGNVLNSVNVSASTAIEQVSSSHIDLLLRAIRLIEEQGNDLPGFFANDPRGHKLPALLSRLGEQLVAEQHAVLAELRRLMEQVDLIRSTVDAQQSNARPREVIEELAPRDLVDRALSLFRIDFELKNIELTVDADSAERVLIDRQATLQILVNLIRNAIEAMAEITVPRRLQIKSYTTDDRVHFEVIDNGCGIPEENLVKIFHHGFTTKQSGHGFGLHASANAARAMDGSLTVVSDGPGHGARFSLSLPRHTPTRS